MTQHGALSIIVPISPGRHRMLSGLLDLIDTEGAATNSLIPFGKCGSIHFARFVMLDAVPDVTGRLLPDQLCFTTNYDGDPAAHIRELIRMVGKGLWTVFSNCVGFPSDATPYEEEALRKYLQASTVPTITFYVGVGPRSVDQIRKESALRLAIGTWLNAHRGELINDNVTTIRNKIITFVNSRDDLKWAAQAETPPPPGWTLAFYGKPVLALLLLIVLLPLIIPLVVIWLLIMLIHEVRDPATPQSVTNDRIRQLVNRETGAVQAQFSAAGNIKPGWFRLTTLRALLTLTNFLAPYIFSQGKLSGIPTVHFARWLIIDKGRQLLFLSNYDGNSESYLRDFIHIAAKQLTLLFCHTEGYPKTWLMVFGGAKDANGFMQWARHNQLITNVWYSANPNVTVNNVYTNGAIRNGLSGQLSEAAAADWLKKF